MKIFVSIILIYFLASCANKTKPDFKQRDSGLAQKELPFKEQIRQVIRKHKFEIKACYEKALNKNRNVYGKIVLEWHFIKSGTVTKSKVIYNSTKDEKLGQCLAKKIKEFKFPEIINNKAEEAVVKFPFVFSSK